jgi:hypothetical protein
MRPERSPIPLALAAAILGLIAHAALLRGFWSDDAFITYRYARNIAAGAGAVFNPGQRVEGFSNPVFTLLLAAVYRLVPDVTMFPVVARGIGLASAVGALIALAACPGVELRRGIALGLLLTAASTSFALWSVGGLETSQYCFLITLGFALTLRRPRGAGSGAFLGLVLALITLSRPEGILAAGALFLWRFLDPGTRHDWRGHALVAGVAALPVAAYLAFRLSYYGDWLPNTFYAKHQLTSRDAFWRGVWYLKDFFERNGNLPLYAPTLFAFRADATRRAAWVGALVLAIDLPFNLIVGADWMDQHRFIAPLTPILYLMVGLGWIAMLDLLREGLRSQGSRSAAWVVPAGAAFAWLLLALPNAHLTKTEREQPAMSVIPYFTVMSRVIGVTTPADWTVATHDIGAVGWYGGTRVLDMIGLVDRQIQGRWGASDRAIAERRPELVMLHYDNRHPPLVHWRPVEMAGFDSLYVLPRGIDHLPRSLRVRADVAEQFDRNLGRVPPGLRAEVSALYEHLRTYHPDMYPVLVSDPP